MTTVAAPTAAMTISVSSTEYVAVPVTAFINQASYNMTNDAVAFDFQVWPTPVSPTRNWQTGSWETGGPPYRAICLVGPGGVVLTAGLYDTWVRVSDNPEIPVRLAGQLLVSNP